MGTMSLGGTEISLARALVSTIPLMLFCFLFCMWAGVSRMDRICPQVCHRMISRWMELRYWFISSSLFKPAIDPSNSFY